ARHAPRVQGAGPDSAPVALMAHDAEVAELEAAVLAHEDVHGSQVAVEHLPSVEAAEDLEDPGDLAPSRLLRPALAGALEERPQVSGPRVREGEEVEDAAVLLRQRERVEDPDRARIALEDPAEIRLAHPAVDVHARLDRHDAGDLARARQPGREVGLA